MQKLFVRTNTQNLRFEFESGKARAAFFRDLRDAGYRGRMVHGQGLTLFHPETHDREGFR